VIPPVFTSANADAFCLDILGYELADFQKDGGYDWLMVGISACAAGRCWGARFPCMQWDEANALAAWFEESATAEPERTEIRFTEPNLYFEYLGREGNRVRIRVLFSAEFRPPWRPYEPGQRRDARLDFDCTSAAVHGFARWVRERLARYPRRVPGRADVPDATEPSDNVPETTTEDDAADSPLGAGASFGLSEIDDAKDDDPTDEAEPPDLGICVGQTCGRLSVQSVALLVGNRVFQEKEMRPWTCTAYTVRDPCVLLGIAEGVPGLPRPNAVAKFLLQAVAELNKCDAEPRHPLDEEVLRGAHKMLCEEADLRRFAGGAACVALAEVRIDRVVTLYTAPAGIFLVDRRTGEVTSLATRGHTAAGDASTRRAIVADPEQCHLPVYRTQAALTCQHAVLLCSDDVTGLVSEREIGQIVQNAGHRADAAEAMLDAVDVRGGSDNASIIVCDFTCPAG
jgi:hypothetical protein